MKRSSESIRQYLKTAAMTFALLEISALPVLSAFASEPNQPSDPDNSASPAPDAPTQQDATTVPAAIAPPTSASEVYHVPSQEGRTTTTGSSTENAATVTTPESTDQPESLPSAAGAGSDPATEIPASNSIEATRQALADKLAAIVERDQPTRAVQLRQNLVAAAIQYAEAGAFDQARQTAQHPALPAQVQAETLAKIDQLERSAQALRQVEPGRTELGRTELGRTVAQQDIMTRLGAATPRLPASWVLPLYPGQMSAPEQMSDYTGGMCMAPDLANQQRSPHLTSVTSIAQPENIAHRKIVLKASQQLSLQELSLPQVSASQISTSQISTSQVSASQVSASQISALAGVALDRVADNSARKLNREKIAPTQQLSQSLHGLESSIEPSDVQLLDVDNLDDNPVVNPLQLNRMVGSALTASLRQIGIELPQMMPAMLPSIAWQSNFQSAHLNSDTREPAADINTEDAAVSEPIWITTNFVALMLTESLSVSTVQQSPLLLQGFGDASQIATIGSLLSSQPAVETVGTSGSECHQMFRSFEPVDRSIASSPSGSIELAFPLPIPAEITSLFGWRIHPISHDRRLHTGVDLGASMGTPVLAALSGQVVVANAMGGYGLTVVIENRSIPQRNLYAHLSGIAVQPGAQVTQGSVIGWVGSTGNSTGPHLHFETQMLTTNGWIAVDPLPRSGSVARGY